MAHVEPVRQINGFKYTTIRGYVPKNVIIGVMMDAQFILNEFPLDHKHLPAGIEDVNTLCFSCWNGDSPLDSNPYDDSHEEYINAHWDLYVGFRLPGQLRRTIDDRWQITCYFVNETPIVHDLETDTYFCGMAR